MLMQARLEADRQRAELVDKAREEVHSLETKWQEDLDRERQAFLLDLRRRAAMEILAVARRTVADLAGTDVQQCAIRIFLEKFRSLDSDARMRFAQGALSIRSPFEFTEELSARLLLFLLLSLLFLGSLLLFGFLLGRFLFLLLLRESRRDSCG